MLYKFEKLLRDNNISETDPDLPRAIINQIAKFRKLQSAATPNDTLEDIEARDLALDELDKTIMSKLPDFFDIEDEAELKAAEAKKQAAKAQEEEAARKKKQEEEDNTPATSDRGALEKLYKRGKKTVTLEDLKAAGFNTGFFGQLGPNGCIVKDYKLYREDPFAKEFELIKK